MGCSIPTNGWPEMAPDPLCFTASGSTGYGLYKKELEHGLSQAEFAAMAT